MDDMQIINIRDYLSGLPREEVVCYCPNPGNAGDSLIACATFQLFSELKVKYRLLSSRHCDPKNKIFIYGGGGNLIKHYPNARDIIRNSLNKGAKKIIVLPHTIDDQAELLLGLKENADVICREKISYDYVKATGSTANVFLTDDMAFCLKLDKILPNNIFEYIRMIYGCVKDAMIGGNDFLSAVPSWKQIILYCLREIKLKWILITRKNSTLNCFRLDVEKTEIEIPIDNIDLSHLLGYGTQNSLITSLVSNQLLRFINKYEKIRTNRLHMAIAGALLKKDVELFPGNYYKIEEVYKFSMLNKFPNVRYVGHSS